MADDLGTLYTDKKLQTLERKLKAEYRKAQKDIEEKTKIFFDKAAAKDKVMQSRLSAGKITQEEYDHWRQGKIFYGENWKAQQESIAKVLADTNKVATAMINGEKADVFAFNGNYTGYELEHGFGVNFGFDLYSEKSVERLLKDNPKLMPPKRLDRRKDIPWNMRNIRSQVTQGLIQGESIPKIAKRLSEVVPNRNAKQMVLHARTAMTGAQNGGRMERFKEAEALGIKFKKVWIATLDSRTRDRHADLDGQAVKPDEYFDSGKFRIMFPGDPNGEPSTVWNCRCTLGTKLDDYPRTFTRRAYDIVVDENGKPHRESKLIQDMTYKQWIDAKTKGVDIQATQLQSKQPLEPQIPLHGVFTPAKSIKEAEEYAKQFLGYNGKVSYNGLDLEFANTCNRVLTDIHENYDVKGLAELSKMNLRKKEFQNSTAEAAYKWGSGGLYINPTFYKTQKAFEDHKKDIDGLMETVLKNGQVLLDNATNPKKRQYIEALINTGRQCVSQSHDFFEASIVHECGHMLDDKKFFNMLRKDLNEEMAVDNYLRESMMAFGGKISGYAVTDTQEYIAESFTAWWYGESDICDPKITKVFRSMLKNG